MKTFAVPDCGHTGSALHDKCLKNETFLKNLSWTTYGHWVMRRNHLRPSDHRHHHIRHILEKCVASVSKSLFSLTIIYQSKIVDQ